MAWGDRNSAGVRAAERRARKGLDSPARRRVLKRGAKDASTRITVVPEAEDEELHEQNSRSFLWRFR